MSGQSTISSTFHRPPREYPEPVPSEPLRLGPPPTVPAPPHYGVIQALFPVVGAVGILGFALVFGNSAFLWIALAMVVLLIGFSVALRWSQRRAVRMRAEADARRYIDYLRERDRELAAAGELQSAALDWFYPDPGKVWTAVVKRRGVWERRPNHADFLRVRLGRGTVPLDRPVELDLGINPMAEYQQEPLDAARELVERRANLDDQPVVVDLSEVGVLAVTGDRPRARAWARGLMTQLAAFRAPHDLRLVTGFDPADAAEWEWAKWLPHQRADLPAAAERAEDPGVADGAGPPMVSFARSPAELEAMLEAELRPRLEQLRRFEVRRCASSDAAGPSAASRYFPVPSRASARGEPDPDRLPKPLRRSVAGVRGAVARHELDPPPPRHPVRPLSIRTHGLPRPRRLAARVALIIAVLGVAVPSSAQAAFPGRNGRVAFDRLTNRIDLFSIQPTRAMRLRREVRGGADASYSADGRWIVYSTGGSLRIAAADGTSRRIVPNTRGARDPEFSPDGERIVFHVDLGGVDVSEIVTVRTDGSDRRTVAGRGQRLALSPDGSLIAF